MIRKPIAAATATHNYHIAGITLRGLYCIRDAQNVTGNKTMVVAICQPGAANKLALFKNLIIKNQIALRNILISD